MGLAEIAAGLEVTTEQRDRGVATVNDAGDGLTERLGAYADTLPCSAETAAALIEAYAAGKSVEHAGETAGVPAMTAAKVLHLVGVDGVCPMTPQGRAIIRDWLDARVTRSEARELTGVSETEFELTVYIETHDSIPGARAAIEPALGHAGSPTTQKRDLLAETMTGADEFRN
ncbi:MAG: hypothetical protein ACLFR6_06205 [Salinarchaeum sp.]